MGGGYYQQTYEFYCLCGKGRCNCRRNLVYRTLGRKTKHEKHLLRLPLGRNQFANIDTRGNFVVDIALQERELLPNNRSPQYTTARVIADELDEVLSRLASYKVNPTLYYWWQPNVPRPPRQIATLDIDMGLVKTEKPADYPYRVQVGTALELFGLQSRLTRPKFAADAQWIMFTAGVAANDPAPIRTGRLFKIADLQRAHALMRCCAIWTLKLLEREYHLGIHIPTDIIKEIVAYL